MSFQESSSKSCESGLEKRSVKNYFKSFSRLDPRARSAIFMTIATAFHYGGYEFFRNSCLTLFTSSDYGFSHPAAFPFATALVSPFSFILLWGYSQQLETYGPRLTLWRTTMTSIIYILLAAASLEACQAFEAPKVIGQILIGVTYLFQNSYQYLLHTQEWSFLSSIMTPQEGSRWFARMAGASSLTSTISGSLVGYMTPKLGLLGLMATTCIMLTVTLFCQDYAYSMSQQHNFEPHDDKMQKQKKLKRGGENKNSFRKAIDLFRRVPTLRALLCETLAFQSLNTILNTAFVSALKKSIPNDIERSSYTGQLFSLINACSTMLQFVALPIVLPRTEPAFIWRMMPILPLVVCFQQVMRKELSLNLLVAAFSLVKLMDYSFHTVVVPLVYQPLDFHSRYLGKEIIGVLGSRFGKSGMSLILSGLTAFFGPTKFGVQQLVYLSAAASVAWTSGSWWIGSLMPNKADAQSIVEDRAKEKDKSE